MRTYETLLNNQIESTPPEDLREYVKIVFPYLADFCEDDFDILTEYIRCLWIMRSEREQFTLKRLELLMVLQKQNQRRIFEEKQKLFAQLAALETLNGSNPLD